MFTCKWRKPWTETGRQVNLLWDKYRQVRWGSVIGKLFYFRVHGSFYLFFHGTNLFVQEFIYLFYNYNYERVRSLKWDRYDSILSCFKLAWPHQIQGWSIKKLQSYAAQTLESRLGKNIPKYKSSHLHVHTKRKVKFSLLLNQMFAKSYYRKLIRREAILYNPLLQIYPLFPCPLLKYNREGQFRWNLK